MALQHSIRGFSKASAAGAMGPADALRIVRRRGELSLDDLQQLLLYMESKKNR